MCGPKCDIVLSTDEQEDVSDFIQFFKRYGLLQRLMILESHDVTFEFLSSQKSRIRCQLIIVDLSGIRKSAGLYLVKKIKGVSEMRSIPLVALTDKQEEAEIIELHRLSVNALLLKPVNLVKFQRIVSFAGITYDYFKNFLETDMEGSL